MSEEDKIDIILSDRLESENDTEINFSILMSGSLQTTITRLLIEKLSSKYTPNVICMALIRDYFKKLPPMLHSYLDVNIKSALITSRVMLKVSVFVIHCRFFGHVSYENGDTADGTKKYPDIFSIPICDGRTATMSVFVRSRKIMNKTDVLIKIENGLLPSDMVHDKMWSCLRKHNFHGYLRDAKVIYFFSRGKNSGQKKNFIVFFNDTSQISFQEYLWKVNQDIGLTLINADPSEASKYKKDLSSYSFTSSHHDPELEDWDTCPCYSAECNGTLAPIELSDGGERDHSKFRFFEQDVCNNS